MKFFRDKRGGFGKTLDITNIPCCTVLAYTIGNLWIEDDGKPMIKDKSKPEYKVPSMEEIKTIPWNGFKVASTFSGAGGSCTGYRMAGFKVIWANEFVPAAQDTYKANAAPDCYLDRRDIRQIQPDEILKQTGLKKGELDLFDGSPPCASFSTAGKREKGWGKTKQYSDTKQRVDDLFFQYSRILKGLMPKVFVAENVSGLLKGTAKGMFLEILKDLKDSGYNVKCKLLDAQWLGVPQMRQRAIFIGVRNDLNLDPAYPKPLQHRYSVADALPKVLHTLHYGQYQNYNGKRIKKTSKLVCESVRATQGGSQHFWLETPTGGKRKFTIPELKRICAFPDDFILTGTYAQQWERLGRSVPPVMMSHIAETIRKEILCKIT